MRRIPSIGLALLLLLAVAAPVAAARPEGKGPVDVPVGSLDFVITTDIGCADFDVLVEDVAGSITQLSVGNGRVITQFRTVTRYTNVETGASFERQFHSLGSLLERPDGTITIYGSNDALVWGADVIPLGLPDGIWLIDHGRIEVTYDAVGDVIDGTFYSGDTLDVCAALS